MHQAIKRTRDLLISFFIAGLIAVALIVFAGSIKSAKSEDYCRTTCFQNGSQTHCTTRCY